MAPDEHDQVVVVVEPRASLDAIRALAEAVGWEIVVARAVDEDRLAIQLRERLPREQGPVSRGR